MGLRRVYRAECEFRAMDRAKRYNITDQELAIELSTTLMEKEGIESLAAINKATGMIYGWRQVNDGHHPMKDAVDNILTKREKNGLNRDGTVKA